MKKFFRHSGMQNKGNSEHKNCPNCGYDSSNGHLSETEEVEEVVDENIKAATKIVVAEAMKVFQPLLDKLGEASKQLNEEQGGSPAPGQAQNFEDQLANLQSAAVQRQKFQEQKVAKKMQKIQSRFGG